LPFDTRTAIILKKSRLKWMAQDWFFQAGWTQIILTFCTIRMWWA